MNEFISKSEADTIDFASDFACIFTKGLFST